MRTPITIPRPHPFVLLLTPCFLCVSGCGGGSDKVVAVTGKVTHNDKPVAGIIIAFVPEAATASGVSTGTTNANGEYNLKVSKTGRSGAVVGTHKVWVSVPRKPPEEGDNDKKPKKAGETTPTELPADTEEILKKYGSLKTTPLKVEVKGDPIDLKLD
jgi:hypothetical protein